MIPMIMLDVVLLERQPGGLLCRTASEEAYKEVFIPFKEMPWDEGEDLVVGKPGKLGVSARWYRNNVKS